jgi:hypothetical protein
MSQQSKVDLRKLVPSVAASLELADEGAAEERLHEALVAGARSTAPRAQRHIAASEPFSQAPVLLPGPARVGMVRGGRPLPLQSLLLVVVGVLFPVLLAILLSARAAWHPSPPPACVDTPPSSH